MSKGGMSANPFAGNPSMNNLDEEFMDALFKGQISYDQALSLRIIKMSVRDYLYFGLGKNGITPEKFLEAYSYLFFCRATDPTTWGNCEISNRYRNLDGILERSKSTLSPKEIQSKCFDTHYDLSGLCSKIPISYFLKLLKKKRTEIVNANLKQITAYMGKYRREEWARLPRTKQKGKHAFPRVGVVSTLVSPKVQEELGRLYLFGRSIKDKKASRKAMVALPTGLKYKTLLF